ncbi:hypothetical protein ID866_12164 [Astraeus odoratus]|nr:hypothetical protein ID866_12164 [Astraeus odoratus]
MAGKMCKQKWVWHSEEMEGREVVNVDTDDDEDEEQSHFAVLTHLAEEHRDTLGALTMTLDTLSTDLLKFWRDSWNLGVAMLWVIETIANKLRRANDLKEEEMGRSKGKGKEKAQEEFRGARTEDDDGDTEMGGAGPSSLVKYRQGKDKEKGRPGSGFRGRLHGLRVWSWLARVPLVEVPNKFGGVPQLHG